MNKYVVRRSGQIVGTYSDRDQAFAESLPNDRVFKTVETHGEWGCIKEQPIKQRGTI